MFRMQKYIYFLMYKFFLKIFEEKEKKVRLLTGLGKPFCIMGINNLIFCRL